MNVPRAGLRIAVVGVSSLIGAAVVDELRLRKMAVAELHGIYIELANNGPGLRVSLSFAKCS